MAPGMPINRKWFFVLRSGIYAMDWGEGLAQNLLSGEFIRYQISEQSHAISDAELEKLQEAGRISHFDMKRVYILARHNAAPSDG